MYSKKEILIHSALLNLVSAFIKRGRKLYAEKIIHVLLWKIKYDLDEYAFFSHLYLFSYSLIRLQCRFRMIVTYPTLSTIKRIPVPATLKQRESRASRMFIFAINGLRKKIDLEKAKTIVFDICLGRFNAATRLKIAYMEDARTTAQNIRLLKFKGSWWMSTDRIR